MQSAISSRGDWYDLNLKDTEKKEPTFAEGKGWLICDLCSALPVTW